MKPGLGCRENVRPTADDLLDALVSWNSLKTAGIRRTSPLHLKTIKVTFQKMDEHSTVSARRHTVYIQSRISGRVSVNSLFVRATAS